MEEIPILVVGDAPNLQTGLARIARDILHLLKKRERAWGIKVSQLGWGYDGSPQPWPTFPVMDTDEWGGQDILKALRWAGARGGKPAVVLTVWDPSRCYPITRAIKTTPWSWVKLWGYFAVDSHNEWGSIGGPAQEALWKYDRVLAYSSFGARVLQASFPTEHEHHIKVVEHLPHGIEDQTWTTTMDPECPRIGELREMRRETDSWDGGVGGVLVGCVAANQPRKDFGLLFRTLRKMEAQGEGRRVRAWICTDRKVTTAWSIPELAETYGFNRYEKLIVMNGMSDRQLAEAYRLSDVTLGIGLGEGFGYPPVESLACGTRAVCGGFGGGAEFVPPEDLVKAQAMRVEGPYALVRPVYEPEEWARRALAAAEARRQWRARESALCTGSVAHLRWSTLEEKWAAMLQGWLTPLWVEARTREKREEREEQTGEEAE